MEPEYRRTASRVHKMWPEPPIRVVLGRGGSIWANLGLALLVTMELPPSNRMGSAARSVPFLDFPEDLRRIMYTTNAIESFSARVRKLVKGKSHFPNDNAAFKRIYLAVRALNGEIDP